MSEQDWREVTDDLESLMIAETVRIETPYVRGLFVVENIEERTEGAVAITTYTFSMLTDG